MDQGSVMAWLDDRAWAHPKLTMLSDGAFRAWVSGVCYSSGFGVGGRLELEHQRLIGASSRVRGELVNAGLWDDMGEGAVLIHDWSEHNDKRDARRAAARDRKRKQRDKERDSTRDIERDEQRDRNAVKEVKEVTVTVERPNGLTTAQSLVGEYVDQVRALGAEPAARAKGQVARQIGELLSEGQPFETIQGAIGLLVERRLHPSTLPTLLLEATAGPARRSNVKGVSAKDIFGMAGRQLEAGT